VEASASVRQSARKAEVIRALPTFVPGILPEKCCGNSDDRGTERAGRGQGAPCCGVENAPVFFSGPKDLQTATSPGGTIP
jgi:hypothetical protein